jgi:hypothetical protein
MSYAADTSDGLFVAHGSNLNAVLRDAIDTVAGTGQHVTIKEIWSGNVLWDLEPDTKVSDDDPFYPVIVHVRTLAREEVSAGVER